MKTRLFLIAGLLICSICGNAQQYDVLDQVRADWRKACGMEGPHRFDTAPLTKAPKGYKAFYVSHYGRHGSRYAWNSETYKLLHKVLTEAHETASLTEDGEAFYRRFEEFYPLPLLNSGDLTDLGFMQNKKLGEYYYDTFPEVFKGDRRVNAIVSTSPRSIVSMSSFCLSLKGRNPKLDIYQSSNHSGLAVVTPTSAPKEIRKTFKGQNEQPSAESVSDFYERTVDYDGILSKLFKDKDFVKSYPGGRFSFCFEYFQLWCGYRNYYDGDLFGNLLSPEQILGLWEATNYYSYRFDLTSRYANIPLLEDIVDKAEDAFGKPELAADLRFGHDYVLEAFMTLLDVNGSGTVPEKSSDVKYWYQNFNISMAATAMFVFYKDKKGDILFKLLWNEEEASLPQLKPVTGCYYRWSDFKAWSEELIEKQTIN